MPYASQAQAGYFHAHKKELEAQGVNVSEWDRASKGKKLPKRKSKKTKRAFPTHGIYGACFRIEGHPMAALDSQVPGLRQALFSAIARYVPEKSADAPDGDGNGETTQNAVNSVLAVPPKPTSMDAAKAKIAAMRCDSLLVGPMRRAWHAKCQREKQSFVGRASVQGNPATAWQNLMQLVRPAPARPAPQGLNLTPTSPGGEFGGRNTPSKNPIGLMSGLGMDPGGSSVMGNAAFGTQNNVVKISQRKRAADESSLATGDCGKGTSRDLAAHRQQDSSAVAGSLPDTAAVVKQAIGPYDRLPGQRVSRSSQYYASRRADALRSAARRAGTPMGIGRAQELARGSAGSQYPSTAFARQMAALRRPSPSGKHVNIAGYRLTPEQVQHWVTLDPAQRQQYVQSIKAYRAGQGGQMTPYGFAYEGNRATDNPAWSYLSQADIAATPQRVPGAASAVPSLAGRPATAPAGSPGRPAPPALAAARQQPATPSPGPGVFSSWWRSMPWNQWQQGTPARRVSSPTAAPGPLTGPVLRAPSNAPTRRPQIPASVAEAMAGGGGRRLPAPGSLRPPRVSSTFRPLF